jgi:hypothetical protein
MSHALANHRLKWSPPQVPDLAGMFEGKWSSRASYVIFRRTIGMSGEGQPPMSRKNTLT